MTAEKALIDSLWHQLPTEISSEIENGVLNGFVSCTISKDFYDTLDIELTNNILLFLGFNIVQNQNDGNWNISWDAGYRDRF